MINCDEVLRCLEARGRDVRLRPYVADELGWFAWDTPVVGNVRESRGRAQDGSVHMQRSLPSSSYHARSTLSE